MMPRYPKGHTDVEYYVPGRTRRVTGSTIATSNFLAVVHQMNPTATISQLYDIITDRSQWFPNPEAITVLESHISAGYGGYIPDWR